MVLIGRSPVRELSCSLVDEPTVTIIRFLQSSCEKSNARYHHIKQLTIVRLCRTRSQDSQHVTEIQVLMCSHWTITLSMYMLIYCPSAPAITQDYPYWRMGFVPAPTRSHHLSDKSLDLETQAWLAQTCSQLAVLRWRPEALTHDCVLLLF